MSNVPRIPDPTFGFLRAGEAQVLLRVTVAGHIHTISKTISREMVTPERLDIELLDACIAMRDTVAKRLGAAAGDTCRSLVLVYARDAVLPKRGLCGTPLVKGAVCANLSSHLGVDFPNDLDGQADPRAVAGMGSCASLGCGHVQHQHNLSGSCGQCRCVAFTPQTKETQS